MRLALILCFRRAMQPSDLPRPTDVFGWFHHLVCQDVDDRAREEAAPSSLTQGRHPCGSADEGCNDPALSFGFFNKFLWIELNQASAILS